MKYKGPEMRQGKIAQNKIIENQKVFLKIKKFVINPERQWL